MIPLRRRQLVSSLFLATSLVAGPLVMGFPVAWAASPIDVSTAAQLLAIDQHQSAYLDAAIVLTNNITLPAQTAWVPFGSAAQPFDGSFNGQGYTIANVAITNTESSGSVGFFGGVGGSASIEHLTLSNVSLTDTNAVNTDDGLLVGYLTGNAVINHAQVTGTLAATVPSAISDSTMGGATLGGIVGLMNSGTVTSTQGSVTLTYAYSGTDSSISPYIGGFVGEQNTGLLSNDEISGTVALQNAPNSEIGGFVGEQDGGSITTSRTSLTETVQSSRGPEIGGFAGGMWGGTDSVLAAQGSITVKGTQNATMGGFVGEFDAQSLAQAATTDSLTLSTTSTQNVVAGFAGDRYNGTVYETFTTTALTLPAENQAGEFVGNDYASDPLSSSYAAVPITVTGSGSVSAGEYAYGTYVEPTSNNGPAVTNLTVESELSLPLTVENYASPEAMGTIVAASGATMKTAAPYQHWPDWTDAWTQSPQVNQGLPMLKALMPLMDPAGSPSASPQKAPAPVLNMVDLTPLPLVASTQSPLSVTGYIGWSNGQPNTQPVRIVVNGRSPLFTTPSATGNFSYPVTLAPGWNTLTVSVGGLWATATVWGTASLSSSPDPVTLSARHPQAIMTVQGLPVQVALGDPANIPAAATVTLTPVSASTMHFPMVRVVDTQSIPWTAQVPAINGLAFGYTALNGFWHLCSANTALSATPFGTSVPVLEGTQTTGGLFSWQPAYAWMGTTAATVTQWQIVNGTWVNTMGNAAGNTPTMITLGQYAGFAMERAALAAGLNAATADASSAYVRDILSGDGVGLFSPVSPQQQGQWAALYQQLHIIPTVVSPVSAAQGLHVLQTAHAPWLAQANYLVQLQGFSWPLAMEMAEHSVANARS